ncbi:MAG: (d)CMP kinase [Gammaproteobacteria bacterium]|jgi:cytidylate kinase
MSGVPVITIDGPSGSGKGTLSRLLARRCGWHWLDSGALYRLTALAATRTGIALDDVPALAEAARGLQVEFPVDADGESRVLLAGEDVGSAIRTEQVGNAASQVAAIPAVREALLARQRTFAAPPGLVADGRDMGTVVFPDAPLKIFLTASLEERAKRRYNQLKEQGLSVNLHALFRELAERDARDQQRDTAPLKPAEDAVEVDTTGIGIDEVLARLVELARSRGLVA